MGAVDDRCWCKRWPCAKGVDCGTEMERNHRYAIRRNEYLLFNRK